MEIDIDHLAKEFQKHYPVDGMIGVSTVGVQDPDAPEYEQEMSCLWVGLHRHNKVKLPKMYRGLKIFTKLIGKVRTALAA